MTRAARWRELKPRLDARVEGLVDEAPVLDNGATVDADDSALCVTGPGTPWSYLVRLRLRPRVVASLPARVPLVVRITAAARRGRVGAIVVTDDLQTVLSNSVEWVEDEGETTLSLVVYASADRGWLVFRNMASASPGVRLRISSVEVFRLHSNHPPPVPSRVRGEGRAVIYTAITNHYDTLKPPQRYDPDCDYVCLTDDGRDVPAPWRPMRIERTFRDPRMTARWCKVHPHVLFPSHDVSIWIDGRIELRREILPLARGVLGGVGLATFDNPWCQCVYLDAESVSRERRDAPDIVEAQIDRYRQAGLPRHLGDVSTGMTIRRHHDPAVVRLAAAWWDELERGSHRDQISLGYLLWKHQLPFRRIWLAIDDNPYLGLGEHNFVDYYRA